MKTPILLIASILELNLVSAQEFMCGAFVGVGAGWMLFMMIASFLITALIIVALILFILWSVKQLQSKNKIGGKK